MGKLIKRPVKSQILGSNSFFKTRSNNPFGFKTTSDIFALPSGTVSTIYTVATGGVITQVGDYKVHTFNSSSNFVVSTLGTDATVEYLVVAGGGGGGGYVGAGGAGGLLTNTGLAIAVQTYSVVVGSGGANGNAYTVQGTNGNTSSFNSISTVGGGGGGGSSGATKVGVLGGSGGGGGGASGAGGAGTAGQGFAGGAGTTDNATYTNGGGGGGAGAAGVIAIPSQAGNGGAGVYSSITGTSTPYAGGGGGGNDSGTKAFGVGGVGGGGRGAQGTGSVSGTANTGGGAGGGTYLNPTNGGSGIVIIKYKSPAGPYSVNAQAYFTQVTANGGSLTESEKTYINTFIGALGTDFAEFDRLWIHGLSNSVAARTSLANPTSTMITAVNSPTFTASQGYTGNGTSSYLNTNYNPTTNGVKYTLNSASMYVYSRTDLNAFKIDIGHANATSYSTLDIRDSGSFYRSINQVGFVNLVAVANSLGLFSGVRVGTLDVRSYKNGTSISTDTTASSTLINNNIYVSALNNNGTAAFYSPRQLSVSAIGSGVVNQSTFYTALQALGTSIGWAV